MGKAANCIYCFASLKNVKDDLFSLSLALMINKALKTNLFIPHKVGLSIFADSGLQGF